MSLLPYIESTHKATKTDPGATDKDVLIAMFERAGLARNAGNSYDRGYSVAPGGSLSVVDEGYGSFFTTFAFNDDDSLKQVGAWE